MKKKKNKWDDLELYKDIQVADMNVEGMPWYVKRTGDIPSDGSLPEKEPLPIRETWKLIGTAVLAALFIGMIFLFGIFLFLLFCTTVWL